MNKIVYLVFTLLLICSFTINSQETDTTAKQYTIEQFLNTKDYLGGSISSDEKKILFSSNESGIFNIYSINLDSDNPKQTQLTFSQDHSLEILSGFPNDDRFLYTSDDSGNELDHLFVYEGSGNGRDITPYQGAKAKFEGWSYDNRSFFFSSNARDPKYMDLYEMDIRTYAPTLIYKNDNGLDFGGVSPNKRFVALNRMRTSNDSEIYLYDYKTKQLSNLTPYKSDVKNIAEGFSADSQFLYFLSNENSEFTYLKRYHIPSGNFETIQTEDWDIASAGFACNGRYRITNINADGQHIVKIFDERARKQLELPNLPEGHITGVRFSKTGKSMLLFVQGDRSPMNFYLYDLKEKSYRKLTSSLSSDIEPKDLVDAEVIRYPSYDGTLIPALYYKPHEANEGHKVPAMILVHGGPGGQSIKRYDHLIQYLVNHGYAILAVNNRGSSGYGKSFYKAADMKHGEADLDDCIWAKKFLASTGHIDEDKIGIMGGSYGGYMTLAALAFRPNEMAVGIDIFGVSNWVRTLKSIPAWWENERDILYKKIGDPYTQTDYLESISPLYHAENIVKPLLVIQGANDPRVLKVESDQIIEEVGKQGTPCQYIVFDDEGHGFSKKQNKMVVGKSIVEFLDKYLKGAQ